jgi:hypothetical protein
VIAQTGGFIEFSMTVERPLESGTSVGVADTVPPSDPDADWHAQACPGLSLQQTILLNAQ